MIYTAFSAHACIMAAQKIERNHSTEAASNTPDALQIQMLSSYVTVFSDNAGNFHTSDKAPNFKY
jgi:hypothetical protein